jgi:hypothetical protein
MENFYLFLICFFLCGMLLHVTLLDTNSEKFDDSEIIPLLFSGIFLIIVTFLLFGITLGLQYKLNDYLSGM